MKLTIEKNAPTYVLRLNLDEAGALLLVLRNLGGSLRHADTPRNSLEAIGTALTSVGVAPVGVCKQSFYFDD